MSTVDTTESRTLALRAATAASEKKATDIRILDLGELLGVTDYFVICSASNDRQLRTIVEEVEFRLKRDGGHRPVHREGVAEAGWLVLDYGLIVVHAFTTEQREYYRLERLWRDAPVLEFDEMVGARAGGDADA